MEIFLISKEVTLKIAADQLWVVQTDRETPINPLYLDRIWMHHGIHLPGDVLAVLLEQQVELVITQKGGTPLGILTPWVNEKGARSRKKQSLFALSVAAQQEVAQWLFEKHSGQQRLLQHFNIAKNHSSYKQFNNLFEKQRNLLEAGILFPEDCQESYCSRLYYQCINTILPSVFQFSSRSRQPAKDAYNALINYAYGIFYGITEGAIRRAGLDPYIGFLHKERDGQPALVFDFIESFRPLADEVCISLCIGKELSPNKHFRKEANGVYLNNSGKEILIPALMEFLDLPVHGTDQRSISRKNNIFKKAEQLQTLIANWEYTQNP